MLLRRRSPALRSGASAGRGSPASRSGTRTAGARSPPGAPPSSGGRAVLERERGDSDVQARPGEQAAVDGARDARREPGPRLRLLQLLEQGVEVVGGQIREMADDFPVADRLECRHDEVGEGERVGAHCATEICVADRPGGGWEGELQDGVLQRGLQDAPHLVAHLGDLRVAPLSLASLGCPCRYGLRHRCGRCKASK